MNSSAVYRSRAALLADADPPSDADVAACLPAALRSTLDGLALHAPEIDVVPLALQLFVATFPGRTTTDQIARVLLARQEDGPAVVLCVQRRPGAPCR